MTESLATVTTKGQVTIPSDVRKHLDLNAGDKVVFVVNDDGSVGVRPAQHTLASIRGILPPLPGRKATDFEAEIEEAMEDEAERIVRRMTRR